MGLFSGGGGLFSGNGFDLADPGGFGKGNSKLNPLRRAAVDPLGLFYQPPEEIPSEEKLAREEEERKASLRARINRLYGIADAGDPELDATRKTMSDELSQVEGATRGYYTDALARTFTKAERNTRFNLARQGLLGGSEDSNQQGDVRSDRDLGATRVDEAVRKAIAGLTTQREGERLNAINLVNAGVGDSAVDAAASGLRTSFANANNQTKADLFGDLFSNAADAAASQNVNAANAALLARYKQSLGTFFPATSTTGGRVTATS